MNCGCLDQDVSEDNINMWPTNHSCGILLKNLAAFYPCPKSLPKVKVKSFGLIPLAKEISKHSVVWLLVLTLMKIYNEKEQAEQEKYLGKN